MLKLKTKTLWGSFSTQCCESSLVIPHLPERALCTQITSYAVSYNMSHTQKNIV